MPTTGTHEHTTAARRVPLPVTEPPFDDECGPSQVPALSTRGGVPTSPAVQGSLALAPALPGGIPALPEPAAPLRLVDVVDHAAATAGAVPARSRSKRIRGRVHEPPDPRSWSALLAQGIAEALSGHRPPQQLIRWTDQDVYEMLTHRLAGRVRPDGPRPLVRSVRICRLRIGVVEVTAVVDVSGRCRAFAFRLEADDGHWRCTALDIL
jgi:Family of unknown function (DUF6459)